MTDEVDFYETTPTFSRPPVYEGSTKGIEEIFRDEWVYVVRRKRRGPTCVETLTLCRYPNPFHGLQRTQPATRSVVSTPGSEVDDAGVRASGRTRPDL